MKLSLVAPYYNIPEKYFKPFVESVLSQDWDDYEFIIVNDGSTKEECLAMLRELNDPHIRVINKPNGGCPSARNLGIENISGDILYVADPDDELCPGIFRKAVEAFEEDRDLECIAFSFFSRDGNGEIVKRKRIQERRMTGRACFESMCLEPGHIDGYCWSKMYNVSRIGKENIPRFDGRLKRFDDKFWVIQMFNNMSAGKETVRFVDFPGYIYNRSVNGIHSDPAKWISSKDSVLADYDFILDYIKEREGKGKLYYSFMASPCVLCYRVVVRLLKDKSLKDDNKKGKVERLKVYYQELKNKDIKWKSYKRKKKWIPLVLFLSKLFL